MRNRETQYLFLTLATSPDGRTIYSYDDADLLVKIERRTATGAPQGFSDFVYDYASRKAISREWVYQNGAFVKTEEKRRVFDGLDVVQERNAGNEVTAQLVRDGNISGILSRTTAEGAAFYGYDGNGNVTLLTDASGADVAHYRYDAWGNALEAVGSRASENPYRFSTKEVHAASGLIDFGLRFYSPSMGRWINRDPLEEEGGINLYAMVGNSPVNDVDDYGLQGKGGRGITRKADGTNNPTKKLKEKTPKDPKKVLRRDKNGIEREVARPPGMPYVPASTKFSVLKGLIIGAAIVVVVVVASPEVIVAGAVVGGAAVIKSKVAGNRQKVSDSHSQENNQRYAGLDVTDASEIGYRNYQGYSYTDDPHIGESGYENYRRHHTL